MTEEEINQELLKNFSFLQNKIRIPRKRRIFVEVPLEEFFAVFEFSVKELKFYLLSAITGLDEGQTFGFIYHLAADNGIVLNLKKNLPRENLVLKTITNYFPSAEIYEREIADLLGVKIEGLKEGKRYPLPDDWPAGQFPLRKDWTPQMLKTQQEKKNA